MRCCCLPATVPLLVPPPFGERTAAGLALPLIPTGSSSCHSKGANFLVTPMQSLLQQRPIQMCMHDSGCCRAGPAYMPSQGAVLVPSTGSFIGSHLQLTT